MDTENTNKICAALESILFVYGEPLQIKRIAKLLKTNEAAIKEAIKNLEQVYLTENRGLKLILSDDRVQLATKPEFAVLLEDFVKEEFKESLTPAALETLSLIVYLGPIPRSQIDYYRGVNSSFILRSLLIRGLIERHINPPKENVYPHTKRGFEPPAQNCVFNPRYGVGVYLYASSFDLLKYLGLAKVEELPEYAKFKELMIKQEDIK